MTETHLSTGNIEEWLKSLPTSYDVGITRRMADKIMEAMCEAGGGPLACYLPETLAALVRVNAILIGAAMPNESRITVRKQCAELARVTASQAMEFRKAAKADSLKIGAGHG